MPALPDYPGVLKIRTLFAMTADIDIGTALHFTYTGTAPTDATCNTIANDCEALGVTDLVPMLDANTSLTGVEVTDLSSPTAGHGLNATHTGGSRGGNFLPAAACVLQSMKIARRYRGGKPRAYWPFGVAQDLNDQQKWLSASIAQFTTALTNYIAGIEALSVSGTILGNQVSISYYSGFTTVLNPVTGRTRDVPKVRPAAITPDAIVSWEVNPNVASQRRRNLTI